MASKLKYKKQIIIKTIFVIFFTLLINNTYSNNSDSAKQANVGKVIYNNGYCEIVMAQDSNNNPIYWVMAEIGNALLPYGAKWACLQIVGEDNQEICDRIYDGVEFASALFGTGTKTFKLVKKAIELTVEKATIKSFFKFSTAIIDDAYNVTRTIEAYKKLDYIEWDNISDNVPKDNIETQDYNIKIINATDKDFTAQFSNDGKEWKIRTLIKGTYTNVLFCCKDILQNYGLIRGDNICSYQVFSGYAYRLRFNQTLGKYYIEKI